MRIFSERVPDFSVTLDQIEGEIPLWGSAREERFPAEKLGLQKKISEVGLRIPLVWGDRSLAVIEHSLRAFGLDFELSAAVKLVAGFPVGLQVSLPDQQVDLSTVFPEQESPLSVSNLNSKIDCRVTC